MNHAQAEALKSHNTSEDDDKRLGLANEMNNRIIIMPLSNLDLDRRGSSMSSINVHLEEDANGITAEQIVNLNGDIPKEEMTLGRTLLLLRE